MLEVNDRRSAKTQFWLCLIGALCVLFFFMPTPYSVQTWMDIYKFLSPIGSVEAAFFTLLIMVSAFSQVWRSLRLVKEAGAVLKG